jgi:hypothetical protein
MDDQRRDARVVPPPGVRTSPSTSSPSGDRGAERRKYFEGHRSGQGPGSAAAMTPLSWWRLGVRGLGCAGTMLSLWLKGVLCDQRSSSLASRSAMGTERRVGRSCLVVRAATMAIQWTAPWPTQGDLVEHRVIDPTTMTRSALPMRPRCEEHPHHLRPSSLSHPGSRVPVRPACATGTRRCRESRLALPADAKRRRLRAVVSRRTRRVTFGEGPRSGGPLLDGEAPATLAPPCGRAAGQGRAFRRAVGRVRHGVGRRVLGWGRWRSATSSAMSRSLG